MRSAVDIEQPLFQPFPAEVRFRDYAPFGVYEQTLYFRNNDHVARRIKVLPPQSPYFEVAGPRTADGGPLQQGKVAAGMEVCFVVKFRPQEVKEYRVDLVCCTEREKFVVPVRALGPRAVLALPDDVDFGVTPVKSTRSKSLIVQNVGTCIANFRLKCTHAFTASPSEGIVEVGQTVMLELAFTPERADAYAGEMVVEYVGQTGADERDEVAVALTGVAENVEVRRAGARGWARRTCASGVCVWSAVGGERADRAAAAVAAVRGKYMLVRGASLAVVHARETNDPRPEKESGDGPRAMVVVRRVWAREWVPRNSHSMTNDHDRPADQRTRRCGGATGVPVGADGGARAGVHFALVAEDDQGAQPVGHPGRLHVEAVRHRRRRGGRAVAALRRPREDAVARGGAPRGWLLLYCLLLS